MPDASPRSASSPSSRGASPTLGVVAIGPRDDLERLEHVSRSAGFVSQQRHGPDGQELIVRFDASTDPDAIQKLYEELRSARFLATSFRALRAPAG